MSTHQFLSTEDLPFCKGCGHALVARSVQKALASLEGLKPLDVILVSDIGCIGIIDKVSSTHTFHGLHGRSAALAAGVTIGLANPHKKVLVFLGDGGATIGLQHLMEGAQKNLDLKVIVHNNMLYGMTGGQPSGQSPQGFKTSIMPAGQPLSGFDLCKIFHTAGAPYSQRVIAMGDIAADLAKAFSVKGFAYVEAIELCPSYGVKFNPDRKPADIARENGIEPVLYTNPERPLVSFGKHNPHAPSLLDDSLIVPVVRTHQMTGQKGIVLSGSAGEGVQSAAEFLAEAGMACGLHISKKGSYPVTVGVGFSTAEVILSPDEIYYTGNEHPDAIVATSQDGWDKVKGQAEKLGAEALLIIDSSVKAAPKTAAKVITADLRTPMGARTSSLFALFYLLNRLPLVPTEALLDRVKLSKLAQKIDLGKMMVIASQ